MIQVQGASMWAKLGGVHVAGWVLSILSTAAIAKASQVGIKPLCTKKGRHERCTCLACDVALFVACLNTWQVLYNAIDSWVSSAPRADYFNNSLGTPPTFYTNPSQSLESSRFLFCYVGYCHIFCLFATTVIVQAERYLWVFGGFLSYSTVL